MIKLVATDIDGTILIPEGEFTQKVIDCVNDLKKRNIKVVLVTGRMNYSAKLIADKLGLTTPIISYQGGLVTENNNILYERYLTSSQAEKILEWAKSEKIHVNFYNNDTLYSEQDDDEIKRYCKIQNTPRKIEDLSKIKKDKVNKILAIDYSNPERISKYENELPKLFPDLYIIKSTQYFLEFSNKEASKYCAVKFLQKYWNLKDNEILTIGDQNNDIELLRAGGIKVAMRNATEELKKCADYITDSVYNDGFVKAIKQFCV
ncbi:MAG: Cof-type HAD-IIB family hydrolase [bacterium]|nr:Cof-type HAD-IIB family hydrolase [bacterium]